MTHLSTGAVIADKAYDADDRVVQPLEQAGIEVVIPPRSQRRTPRKYDQELYKARHLIENFFCKLTHFRGIAVPGAKPRAKKKIVRCPVIMEHF